MVRLVNDLLDVSRLARGKVQLERRRFQIRDAVERAIDMANPLIVQRGHTLRRLGARQRSHHRRRYRAHRAGDLEPADQRGEVHAARRTHRLDGDERQQVRSSWRARTTGPASRWSSWRHSSTPSPRVRGRIDRSEGGLGLGLTLARAFTEMHGGTIAYERLERRRQPLHADAAAGGRGRRGGAGGARRRRFAEARGSGFCWSTTISTPARCCSRRSRRPGTRS